MTLKLCSACHLQLPRTSFHANKSQPDGLNNVCRKCRRPYQIEWRQRRREEIRTTGIPLEAFKDKFVVDANGCWLWEGRLHEGGYAILSYRGVEVRVHLGYWVFLNGPKPEGMDLDHLCRIRHCVNPDHLEVTTRKENLNRGAGNKGSVNGSSKLTEEDVRTIKKELETPHRGIGKELANRYGVSQMTISNIKKGIIWGWLD